MRKKGSCYVIIVRYEGRRRENYYNLENGTIVTVYARLFLLSSAINKKKGINS
jgi:hypothetical protein